ncbi:MULTISPECIES: Crp/Fnr family transcriptional regulator [unclassified Paracoccus (in: a-proteobacteria)]|uniref:Crp/Fnr family transcriptional regulator n=1 Tax=unclassified Paracoccus (in: a-proteobacteria) TaxID=2688777 RepID=UPI00160243D8|nr:MULTISPECIES: cyclic nucleotide-binding domain-containing protein [unclassified Paracoccus (in: a-proteobacteria)]MBB1490606.1 cyclic nucleotide-binding domain-containing protein [Paracoccus sp. MC1854]MBB1499284.1 cyclic nucleotide-binding domain-containing protein [Paracoccus sp. MC1862]QQO46055.1 cyclic nucleotide-binding domain-containing protein [Paracoccus sp. MC1862]
MGLALFKSALKPTAQVAFEIEQNKSDAEGSETTRPPARGTADDQDLTAERTTQSWIDRFRLLSRLPKDIRADLETGSTIVSVPAGGQVFAPGQSAENVLVVLSGTVSVQRPPENGRSPPPFELGPGEPCILALSSEMAIEDYGADGIAVTAATLVAIPSAIFVDVFTRSPDFRMFVFEL